MMTANGGAIVVGCGAGEGVRVGGCVGVGDCTDVGLFAPPPQLIAASMGSDKRSRMIPTKNLFPLMCPPLEIAQTLLYFKSGKRRRQPFSKSRVGFATLYPPYFYYLYCRFLLLLALLQV